MRKDCFGEVRSIIFYLIAVAIIAYFVKGYRTQMIIHRRIQDVRTLTDTFLASTNINSIEELIEVSKRQGKRLWNPIRVDQSRPSYRLVVKTNLTVLFSSNVWHPDWILIEETNVKDKSRIVTSTMDGVVFIRSPTNQGWNY